MARIVQNVLNWFRYYLLVLPPETPPAPLERRSGPIPEPVEPASDPEPLAPAGEERAVSPISRPDRDSYGSLYFREDLLEKLPGYCEHLRKMRARDPNAWALYRQVGGSIATIKEWLLVWDLEPAWRKFRPAFGLVYIGDDKDDTEDLVPANIWYYQKILYPRNLKLQLPPPGSEIFEVTIAWFLDGNPVFGVFYIAVDRDGSIIPLKDGRDGRPLWAYPAFIQSQIDDHKKRHPGDRSKNWGSPGNWMKTTFTMVANKTINAMAGGIRVDAKKDGITAQFTIHTERTPYFFKDREKIKTDNGATKRIFHIARTHRRHLADGRETIVHVHYRGLRRFVWHGYDVVVTVPSLHHNPVQSFNAPVSENGDISQHEAGRRIAAHIRSKMPPVTYKQKGPPHFNDRCYRC